jgi:hypothetical protein
MVSTNVKGKNTQALKKEKEIALIALGKMKHKQLRDGNLGNEIEKNFSMRISQIDAEIYTAEGVNIPGQGEGVCPVCIKPLATPTASFCGSCGANVAEYYAQNMAKCESCQHLTDAEGNYCTICGLHRKKV